MKTLLALLLMTTATTAQSRCAERQEVLNGLKSKYSETRRMVGMGPKGIVEMHASDKTGSWTITVTHPNGITCMVAAGTAFEAIAEPQGDGA